MKVSEESDALLMLAGLMPDYISQNDVEGKIECEQFFPAGYKNAEEEEKEEEAEVEEEEEEELAGNAEADENHGENENGNEYGNGGESGDESKAGGDLEKSDGVDGDKQPAENP